MGQVYLAEDATLSCQVAPGAWHFDPKRDARR
jgi:hypothetical protein